MNKRKIQPEHLEFMYYYIEPHAEILKEKRERLLKQYKNAEKADLKIRWKALELAGITHWVYHVLYPYLKDTHIDTALKEIFRRLQIPTTPTKNLQPNKRIIKVKHKYMLIHKELKYSVITEAHFHKFDSYVRKWTDSGIYELLPLQDTAIYVVETY